MPDPTLVPSEVVEALAKELDRRSECARHLDDARKELVEAAKLADCTQLRAVHVDTCGSIRCLDRSRAMLVGSDD